VSILSKDDEKYIKELFAKNLADKVNLTLFVDEKEKCMYCKDTEELLTELSSTNPNITLYVYKLAEHKKEADFLGIDKTPALVVWGKKSYNVYYFGIPAGHEFAALLEDIVDASKGKTRLSDAVREKVKSIDKPVEIKVFVTPTCPYCPRAVRTAHQFAMENKNIKSSMIEAMEFQEMSQKYEVMAVPKVVINDKVSFEGALPEEQFLEYVMSAVE